MVEVTVFTVRWTARAARTLTSAVVLLLVTAGCGGGLRAETGSGPAKGTGVVQIGDRLIPVHVPASYRSDRPAPLVIALHGYTSNGARFESYLTLAPESDRRGFLYATPDGVTDRRADRFWNGTDACCDFYQSGVDDSGFLSSLIAKIQVSYRVDPRRVYLVGHSNGAFMAFRMACEHADQIAAIATLNGASWQDASRCRPSSPVSVLGIHGTADETIAFAGGTIANTAYPSAARTAADWIGFNRCSAGGTEAPPLDLVTDLPGAETSVTRYTAGCAGGSTVHTWTIDGGRHVPSLGPAFAPAVADFLLSQAKP
jgi:polyhydroxybutyrate depolymerase